jgi:hypothetical protein
MLTQFPPGDTPWRSQRILSSWREFSFAFHQVATAIEPTLTLRQMLTKWNPIAVGLADKTRKRKSQEQTFAKKISAYAALPGGYLQLPRSR